jgi:hypothetical protein
MGDGNPGGKEPCRMKERDGAQAGRSAEGSSLPEVGESDSIAPEKSKSCSGPQAYQARRNWTTVSR